jgi:MFS family permease
MQAGTNTHQGAYFIDQELGVAISALSISFNAAFTGIGSLIWGWLVERVPVRYCYAAVAVVMVAALFLFPSVNTIWQALLVASLFGASVGGILVVPR